MDMALKERFETLWAKYLEGAGLPICFFYSDDEAYARFLPREGGRGCIMGHIVAVGRGKGLCLDRATTTCPGGQRYLGFNLEVRPGFEYFLSCGIPGKLEGERYKKTPELVRAFVEHGDAAPAPARFAVFKRWDTLEEADAPEVVIFFAPPDVLSGLFTLANFDSAEPYGVVAPFSAGCGSIVQHPWREKDKPQPRAILGMFDVSARPFVPAGVLSFALPMKRFAVMVGNMEESFLITASWAKVQRRISREK